MCVCVSGEISKKTSKGTHIRDSLPCKVVKNWRYHVGAFGVFPIEKNLFSILGTQVCHLVVFHVFRTQNVWCLCLGICTLCICICIFIEDRLRIRGTKHGKQNVTHASVHLEHTCVIWTWVCCSCMCVFWQVELIMPAHRGTLFLLANIPECTWGHLNHRRSREYYIPVACGTPLHGLYISGRTSFLPPCKFMCVRVHIHTYILCVSCAGNLKYTLTIAALQVSRIPLGSRAAYGIWF